MKIQKKDEPLKANAVNLATFANALCHLNATPLSVAVLAPCAWSENLACGGAWQSVVKVGSACGRSRQSENGAVFGRGTSLSLSRCSHFWHAFAFNLKNFSHTQILKYKFNFFTQNSNHLINSRHFINLSQISSLMQGFFISLPQIFAQFLLINSTQRKYYGRT